MRPYGKTGADLRQRASATNRQRSPATKVKTLLFCCIILYFFFYKSSLLSLHWKEKTLKKPGLMRFFESCPRQRTGNQPATNRQRSGKFRLELSSCKGQLSCFSVVFSKLHVRCREFVALRFTDSPSSYRSSSTGRTHRCAPTGNRVLTFGSGRMICAPTDRPEKPPL